MHSFGLAPTFLFLISCLSLSAHSACFGIHGEQVDASPCNPLQQNSACCSPGWICLANGLCSPGPGAVNNGNTNYYRPACTDPTWNTTECFSGCNGFDGNGLQLCDGGIGLFCCMNFTGCNCSATSLFSLGPGACETTIPLSTVAATSLPATTHATTTSKIHATATAGVTPSAVSSPVKAPPSSKNSTALGLGLGLGLGIPLTAALCALCCLCLKVREGRAHPGHDLKYELGDGKPDTHSHWRKPIGLRVPAMTHYRRDLNEMESLRSPLELPT